MEVLKINSGQSYFIIGGKSIEPEELSRDNLIELLNDIYENDESDNIIIPNRNEINQINNPVEKEIILQIIQKITDFKNNVVNIKSEINAQFPHIDEI